MAESNAADLLLQPLGREDVIALGCKPLMRRNDQQAVNYQMTQWYGHAGEGKEKDERVISREG